MLPRRLKSDLSTEILQSEQSLYFTVLPHSGFAAIVFVNDRWLNFV